MVSPFDMELKIDSDSINVLVDSFTNRPIETFMNMGCFFLESALFSWFLVCFVSIHFQPPMG